MKLLVKKLGVGNCCCLVAALFILGGPICPDAAKVEERLETATNEAIGTPVAEMDASFNQWTDGTWVKGFRKDVADVIDGIEMVPQTRGAVDDEITRYINKQLDPATADPVTAPAAEVCSALRAIAASTGVPVDGICTTTGQ